jgi:hypothetical protein
LNVLVATVVIVTGDNDDVCLVAGPDAWTRGREHPAATTEGRLLAVVLIVAPRRAVAKCIRERARRQSRRSSSMKERTNAV